MNTPTGERLQKVLARAGISSRRHAETLIVAGRVRVNGRVVTELGTRVDPRNDRVEVDGRRIVAESHVYYVIHKPRGMMTTLHDPEGRPTVAEMLKDVDARVFPVGRLDYHTSGVLLVTNDGALAQGLTHPRRHVAKTYVCKVRGVPTDLQLDAWRDGVMLPPTESDPHEKARMTLPADVKVLRHTFAPDDEDDDRPARLGEGSTWLEVTLREGRTRQIHRMAEATGLFVMRLVRVSFAGITAEGLRPGQKRALTHDEVKQLRLQFVPPTDARAGAALTDDGDAVTDDEAAPPRPATTNRGPKPKRAGGRAGRVAGAAKSAATGAPKTEPKGPAKSRPRRPAKGPSTRR